ncbi:MAG: AraC family transcriptional regulator, partial [bacterium]
HIYTVGYYPSDPPETGNYRNIQLKVPKRTDIVVRYKKGYDATTFAATKNQPVYLSNYDTKTLYKGNPSFYLESKKDISVGLGILSNTIDAKPYIGKRVRLTGYLKTKNVQSWSAMWMRVDDQSGKPITSDTMDKKLLEGTKDWMKYEIVLDIDEKSQAISYGVLLAGVGKIWISTPKIEVVDKAIPTTATNNWQKYKIGETLTNARFTAENQ